jgi:hypothetical protein
MFKSEWLFRYFALFFYTMFSMEYKNIIIYNEICILITVFQADDIVETRSHYIYNVTAFL